RAPMRAAARRSPTPATGATRTGRSPRRLASASSPPAWASAGAGSSSPTSPSEPSRAPSRTAPSASCPARSIRRGRSSASAAAPRAGSGSARSSATSRQRWATPAAATCSTRTGAGNESFLGLERRFLGHLGRDGLVGLVFRRGVEGQPLGHLDEDAGDVVVSAPVFGHLHEPVQPFLARLLDQEVAELSFGRKVIVHPVGAQEQLVPLAQLDVGQVHEHV